MKTLEIKKGEKTLEVSDWDMDKEVTIEMYHDVGVTIYLKRDDVENLYSYIGHLIENAPKEQNGTK